MGKNFFSLALGVRFEHSLAELNDVKHEFDQTLNGMINGGEENLIQSPEQAEKLPESEREAPYIWRNYSCISCVLEDRSM